MNPQYMPVQQAQYGSQPLGGYPGQPSYPSQQTGQPPQPSYGQQPSQQSYAGQATTLPPQQSYQQTGYSNQQNSYQQQGSYPGQQPAQPAQQAYANQPAGYPPQPVKSTASFPPPPTPTQGNARTVSGVAPLTGGPPVSQVSDQMSNMNINGTADKLNQKPGEIKAPGDLVNGEVKPQSRYPQMNQYGSQTPTYGAQAGYPTPVAAQNRYPNTPQGYPVAQQGYQTSQAGYPAAQQYPSSQTQQGYPDVQTAQGYQTQGYQTTAQPGYPASQAGYPATQPAYPAGGYPQQPQRKLDPEHMPNPMQVMEDDVKTRSGIFYTNGKGLVPPLVTTEFVVQDQGNASPRFIRSTMYTVPTTSDIMKTSGVPFGLVISPMAEVMEKELPPPVVDMGELGPVRCIRCKAYMCPNMQFIDGGRRFHCLLCKATSDVPAEYFQHLDHTGQRIDRYDRPELVLGAYEFIATKEYCRENTFPKAPALIFVIDVSYNNVKSGLVSLLCANMKELLQNLPREAGQERSPTRVGFITYDKAIHFYNISPRLGQPQMMVVGDVGDMFMPLLEGFLVDPVEAAQTIDALMEQIPQMFADTKQTETVLAPAIQAGLEALKASGVAGKLMVFHSSLPIYEAPGKLKNRDDRKLLGTDKEKTVLTPQNMVYNNLGQDCVMSGCSVDMFVFNNSYVDIATIGQVCRLTGGDIFKYTYFQADLDGDRMLSDLEKTLCKVCAYDAIMRIRTSAGVRPTDFYGHFFMSNATDIELACISPDKGVACEIKHDDKISEEEGVYIQVALLYTSISGVRKIRVLNLALKASSQVSDLYRTCELDTCINFFSKQAIMRLNDSTPKAIKEGLVSRAAQILAIYRKKCATPTSASQLVLPECMKLLPLYISCLLKSDALSGGSDMTVDDRYYTMACVCCMDIPTSVVYFYPRLLCVSDMPEDGSDPLPIRCSVDKLTDDGAYLLENGMYMFLWIGLSVRSEWCMEIFGVPSAAQIDTDMPRIPVLNNQANERLRNLLQGIQSATPTSIRLTLVRQRDKMEVVMRHFLVEDRGVDGSSSYVDFLCHMHKEIRALLTS